MADSFTTTADLLQLGDGNISDIDVSELLEMTPFLAVLFAQEASHEDTHQWLKKTAAPSAGFRSVNAGRENTKAVYTKITQNLKLYDASFAIDVALMKLNSGNALQRREARDHLITSFVSMEKQIIYGTGEDADGFAGLAQEANVNAVGDSMVVNAGGTTADTASSVWAVHTGEDGVSAIYGQQGRIEVGESYQTTIEDSVNGGRYDAMRTPILFWGGLQVATSHDVGRIANLTEDAGKGLTDDLLAELYAKFPEGHKPNYFVATRRSQRQLQQSRTATNQTGAPAPFPSDAFNVPIVVTDQLSDAEALLV